MLLSKKETGTDEDGNSVFIPGTYTISPMNNYMQLLNAFKKQYTREVVWVTIPEGSTVEDIISILVDEYGIASRSEFIHAINEYDYELDFIADIDMTNGRYYRLRAIFFRIPISFIRIPARKPWFIVCLPISERSFPISARTTAASVWPSLA